MKVVITGATGNLGQKARRHLEQLDGYTVVPIDRESRGDPEVVVADLTTFDPSWVRHFAGADAVVHLAAEPQLDSGWPELQPNNVDAVLNVFEAAAEHGPMRFVFASSCTAMDEYFWEQGPIGADLVPKPLSLYGATKAMGERIGKLYAERRGLSVICLRIGANDPGENLPSRSISPHRGLWAQQRWLSNEDFCQAVQKSLDAKDIGFAVVNIISRNHGMRWGLEEAESVIGYRPQSSYAPQQQPLLRRIRTRARRRAYRWFLKNTTQGA